MRTNKKLLSNMIYSGVFQLLFLITPVITIPYVARIFSPSDLGLYATSYSIVMFLMQLASFGMPLYGTRAIAQAKDKIEQSQLLINLWIIQLLATLLVFFGYSIFVYFMKDYQLIYLMQGLLLVTNIFDVSWFFRGIEEIKKTVFRNIVAKIVAIILIFIFVKNDTDLISYILINILGVFIGNLSMVLQLRRYADFKAVKIHLDKKHTIDSFGLLIPQAIENSKGMLPRVILVWLGSYREAGLLDQGLKITNILSGVFYSVVNSMIPRISYLVSKNKIEEVQKVVHLFTLLILSISTIIISGTIAISEFFVPLFFGKGYEGVVPIMNVVIFSLLFTAVGYFFGQGLMLSFSKDKQYQRMVTISALVLVILSLILASFFGAIGISIAYVSAELVIMMIALYHSSKIINIKESMKLLLFAPLHIFGNVIIIVIAKMILNISNNTVGFIIFGSMSTLISIVSLIAYFKMIGFSVKGIIQQMKNKGY